MPPDDILIRSAEPTDAVGISTLLGTPGTVEGTLQLPDMPLASRLEMLQRVDPQGCRLVALHGDEVIGWAALHALPSGLRRAHVRLLAIALAPAWQGRGLGRGMMERLLCTGPTAGPACCASSWSCTRTTNTPSRSTAASASSRKAGTAAMR